MELVFHFNPKRYFDNIRVLDDDEHAGSQKEIARLSKRKCRSTARGAERSRAGRLAGFDP